MSILQTFMYKDSKILEKFLIKKNFCRNFSIFAFFHKKSGLMKLNCIYLNLNIQVIEIIAPFQASKKPVPYVFSTWRVFLCGASSRPLLISDVHSFQRNTLSSLVQGDHCALCYVTVVNSSGFDFCTFYSRVI